GRGAQQLKPGIIRGPGEADGGRVRPGDVEARRCGRECHVLAIATDVAEAKRHSIQGDESPFGPENCGGVSGHGCDWTRRLLVNDGENLARLRIKTRRWRKAPTGQRHVARGNESAVFADIGPIEMNIQLTPTRLRGAWTAE